MLRFLYALGRSNHTYRGREYIHNLTTTPWGSEGQPKCPCNTVPHTQYTCVTSCGQYSAQIELWCCSNTMAHYLEPHTHTMGQLQAIRLVETDPFSTLKQLPFLLLTNQNGGLAESVMWNRWSRLNTSNLGHSWRPRETTAVVFHTLSQFLLTVLRPDIYCSPSTAAYTHLAKDTEDLRPPKDLWDLQCGLLLWINHYGGWLCVLRRLV